MWVPVVLSLLYLGWVFWQRHSSQGAPRVRERAEISPAETFGTTVKILQFYTGTREIAPGAKALLCYGVVNATALRLDPPHEAVWPALSRCFETTPAKSTRYTLTAEGADHTTVSASVEVAVKR